jgi:hypothetical protein
MDGLVTIGAVRCRLSVQLLLLCTTVTIIARPPHVNKTACDTIGLSFAYSPQEGPRYIVV